MRSGLFGLFQHAYLEGWLSGTAEALRSRGRDEPERGAIDVAFFATAYQAGLDHIISPLMRNSSPFIAARTSEMPQTAYSGMPPLLDLFRTLPSPEADGQSMVRQFLLDLACAMSLKRPLVSLTGIPDAKDVANEFPLEIAVPFTNLISSFSSVSAAGMIPRWEIKTYDIQRLQEMMSGGLFHAYIERQSHLDDAANPLQKTLPAVARAAEAVVNHSSNLLMLRKVAVMALDVTPKAVDTLFGKLPGALADQVVKLAAGFLESKSRLLIYDFRPFCDAVRQSLFKPQTP